MFNAIKIIVITLAVIDYLVTPGTVGHVLAGVVVAVGRVAITAANKVV